MDLIATFREYFKEAAKALLESGAYKEGDVIELEITWQSQLNVDLYQGPIEKYWLEAFNHPSVCDGKLTLAVKEYVPAVWTDAYYAKMMVGQFDLGFGGVNGNALNPLNFFEVLKSDNSSGFTLNWGPDTNKPSEDLVWDGKIWSFDALWQAAETGGYFKDGLFVPCHNVELLTDGVKNDDGSVTYTFKGNIIDDEKLSISTKLTSVVIFGYFPDEAAGYAYGEDEVEFAYDAATDVITVTVSAELAAKYAGKIPGYPFGLDFYFDRVVLEIDSSNYNSLGNVTLPE